MAPQRLMPRRCRRSLTAPRRGGAAGVPADRRRPTGSSQPDHPPHAEERGTCTQPADRASRRPGALSIGGLEADEPERSRRAGRGPGAPATGRLASPSRVSCAPPGTFSLAAAVVLDAGLPWSIVVRVHGQEPSSGSATSQRPGSASGPATSGASPSPSSVPSSQARPPCLGPLRACGSPCSSCSARRAGCFARSRSPTGLDHEAWPSRSACSPQQVLARVRGGR